MEYKEERALRTICRDHVADTLSEGQFVEILTLPEVVMLTGVVGLWLACASNAKFTYVTVLLDVGLVKAPVLPDDQVAVLGYLAFVVTCALPTHETPAIFRDNAVVAVPCFKVDGEPSAHLGSPNGADLLKVVTPVRQKGWCALDTFVVFVDCLSMRQAGASTSPLAAPTGTYLDRLFEDSRVIVD